MKGFQEIAPASDRTPNRLVASAPGTKVVRVNAPEKKARKRRSRRTGQSLVLNGLSNKAGLLLQAYLNTLNDPFEYGPVKLGFGTMVGTQLVTAFLRTPINTFTDGSLGVCMNPQVGYVYNQLYKANAGGSAISWNQPPNFFNNAAVGQLLAEARVVSGGIRGFPALSFQQYTGFAYAGGFAGDTINNCYLGSSITTLSENPGFRFGGGGYGAEALVRPTDPVSFEFTQSNVDGFSNTNAIVVNSLPGILWNDMGTGGTATAFQIEYVLNLEGVLNSSSASAAFLGPVMGDLQDDCLSMYYPSIDAVWALIKPRLKPMGTIFTPDNGPRPHNAHARSGQWRAPMSMSQAGTVRRSTHHSSSSSSSSSSLPEMESTSDGSSGSTGTAPERENYFVVPDPMVPMPTMIGGIAALAALNAATAQGRRRP